MVREEDDGNGNEDLFLPLGGIHFFPPSGASDGLVGFSTLEGG